MTIRGPVQTGKGEAIRESRSTDNIAFTLFGLKRNADNEPREKALDAAEELMWGR